MSTHMTRCPRCRTDMGTATFKKLLKATTPSGQVVYAVPGNGVRDIKKALEQQGIDHHGMLWEKAAYNEPIPAGSLCTGCRMQAIEQKAEIDKGGVMFLCTQCGMQGVLRAGSALATETRKMLSVLAPAPCSVKINTCAQHGVIAEDKQ